MHFLLLVTNTDKEPLKTQLAPFDEEREDFFEPQVEMLGTKEAVKEWIDRRENLVQECEQQEKGESWTKQWRKTLEKVRQASFEEQLKLIAEDEGYDIDENGNLTAGYNPYAEWDWWSEGGRWDKWLSDKDGNGCNRCKVKDLDFEDVRLREAEAAGERYDNEIVRAKAEGREPWFAHEDHFPTREEYVAEFDVKVAPYAVLHEGDWVPNEDLGWFKDKGIKGDTWAELFQEWVETLDPETELTVVDCHI